MALGINTSKTQAQEHATAKTRLDQAKIIGQSVGVVWTKEGMRACDDRRFAISSMAVVTYLERAFGAAYSRVYLAMHEVAQSFDDPAELDSRAYDIYTAFRPQIPKGAIGWGAKGTLDIQRIRAQKKQNGQ
jgi:hypothetical protein